MSRDSFSFDPKEQHDDDGRSSKKRTKARPSKDSPAPEPPDVEQNIGRTAGRVPNKERKQEAPDSPRAHYLAKRAYFVRESELQTLAEVGTFRAVAAADLAQISYGGDAQRMEREIRHLKEQSLLSEKVVAGGRNKTIRVFALTKKGARLVRASGSIPENQAIHYGFVKPRDAKHDADLYRLYHAQAERIEHAGGRPTRVLLDYELKRNLNRDLAGLPREQESPKIREEIAKRHGLAIVNGRIPVPDLRVEFETADMERKQLDLELATRNYRPRALAEKAKAGFSMYARREDASRLRRVLDEREITAEILSL